MFGPLTMNSRFLFSVKVGLAVFGSCDCLVDVAGQWPACEKLILAIGGHRKSLDDLQQPVGLMLHSCHIPLI